MNILRRVAILERRTVRAASRFGDYNFRQYFVQHTRDSFADTRAKLVASAAPGADPEAAKTARRETLRALRKGLRKMKRMSLINRLYAKQRVVVDKRSII
jgi:hypothetical protein